jgi:hypothetical protein
MPTTQGKSTKFLAHAEGYGGKLGFRVIPLRPGKKIPLIPNWQNEGTWDVAKIREWWRRWPSANIGILTGRYRDGYFCVIDFDPRNGGGWWDEVGEDVLPDTWVVHTPSGGRHFYYKTTELVRCEKLPNGVDLRGEGGLVVVPPSVFFDDNGKYVGDWVFQIGNMPKDIRLAVRTPSDLDKIRKEAGGIVLVGGGLEGKSGGQSGNGAAEGRSLWLMPPPIPKGMRHDYLVSLAGAFWSAGLSEREVEMILWAGLELLATLDDFDPKREIPNIVKGLQKWEGATYSVGSLLRMLPERAAGVVRRVLTGGVVNGEPVGEPVSAPMSEAGGAPVRELVSPPAGADSGQASDWADGQNGGQDADSQAADAGQGDGEKERGEVDADTLGRRFLVAEIVSKLEVRKGADGTFRYVYRTGDGTELEAACAPEGVRDLLAKLGLKTPLKEVKRLLGIVQSGGADAGESEAKEKKGRKSKTAEVEDIKAILWRYKWVRWQGSVWQVATPKLLRVDLDRIHGIVKQNGLEVGKETLRSYLADIMTDIPKDPLEGIVVTPEPTYGIVGKLRGLWYVHRGELHLVTPNERRIFARGQWPAGVYALDLGEHGVLPDWDGDVIHLLKYWEGITSRLKCPPKVALAMFLPALFGQAHIGLILRGAARSGKSTLLKSLGFLRLGRKPKSPSGIHKRDLLAVLQRRQIVFFDEVKTITHDLEELLKRMITHDGDEIRSLYTDFATVEADLEGSAIFCATNLSQLASDLRTRCFVWDLEEKGDSQLEHEIIIFCQKLWRKALAGAIKLYQMAAKVKRPPDNLLPAIRFRDWLVWAYRYAVVLGAEKEFLEFVVKSKSAAHGDPKYDFLIDLLTRPDFDISREYTLSELLDLAAPVTPEARGLLRSIGKESVRADLIALARDIGYNLTIERKRKKGEDKPKYWFAFVRLQTSGVSGRLRQLLIEAGENPDFDDDDDDTPPPPEPTPHTPPPPVATPPTPTPPPEPTPTPPPDNAASAAKDETKTLTDMEREKKTPPSPPVAGESAAPNGLTENIHPANAPTKSDPKKAPPPSEWVYRAGTTPQDGGGSGGLFTAPQNGQPTTPPQPQPSAPPKNTAQDDEYPNDDELIEYIEERLKLHGQHQLSLETSIEWLRGFLLLHEGKMWELGLKKSYHHIVNREIELQNAIKALGYDELTPENDPRLGTPRK